MSVDPYQITFLNYLGGFEYFFFTARKEYQLIIDDAGETTNNIMSNWPNSYGVNADTILKQTYRNTRQSVVVRSQYLSKNQLDAMMFIKVSPLVQIVYSRNNRRTVLVDTDSFTLYDEKDKTYSIQYTIKFTDQLPSQML